MSRPEFLIEQFRSSCRAGEYDKINLDLSHHPDVLCESHKGLFPIHDVLACKDPHLRFESLKVLAGRGLPICSYSSFTKLAQKTHYESWLKFDKPARISRRVDRAGFNPIEYGFFEISDGYERLAEVLAFANLNEATMLVEDLRDMAIALDKSFLVDFCAAILPQLPRQYEAISALFPEAKRDALWKFSQELTVTQGIAYVPDPALVGILQPFNETADGDKTRMIRVALSKAEVALEAGGGGAGLRKSTSSEGLSKFATSHYDLAAMVEAPTDEYLDSGEDEEESEVLPLTYTAAVVGGAITNTEIAAATADLASRFPMPVVPVTPVPEILHFKAAVLNEQMAKEAAEAAEARRSEGGGGAAGAGAGAGAETPSAKPFKLGFASFEHGHPHNVGSLPKKKGGRR